MYNSYLNLTALKSRKLRAKYY